MDKRTSFHTYKPEEAFEEDEKKITRNNEDFTFYKDLMKSSASTYKKPQNADYEGGSYTIGGSFSWDYYHNDDYDGSDYTDY